SGLYRASVGQYPREWLFAVNAPSVNDYQQGSESDLTRTSGEELRKRYPEWDLQVVVDPKEVVRPALATAALEGTPAPLGTAVARWLLLAVLGLVLLEIVAAWLFAHHGDVNRGSFDNEPPAQRGVLALVGRVGGTVLSGLPWLWCVCGLVLGGVLLHSAVTGDFLGFLAEGPRRGIEQALGIPAPAPGEGSRWRLEFTPYLWSAYADPWLAGTIALAGAVMVFLVLKQDGRLAPRRGRLVLTGLRIGLVLLVLT